MNAESHHSVRRLFAALLDLADPWNVDTVELKDEKKEVEIGVSWPKKTKAPCPTCQVLCPIYDHAGPRWWRHLDTMEHQTRICCRVPRTECSEHGVLTINVPWESDHSHFTPEFDTHSIEVLQSTQSQTQTGILLDLNWEQVHNIQERAVSRGIERRPMDNIERIGIDEKSFGKHHNYVTILCDITAGNNRVLEIVEGRKEVDAKKALKTIPKAYRKQVKVAAMDMWQAYMNAVYVVLPGTDISHDHFHITSHLNKGIDEVRRKENAELSKKSHDWLKGKRYLFLKNPDDWKADEKECFEELQKMDLKVTRAWGIRESFEHFWSCETPQAAKVFFDDWYKKVMKSKLKPMMAKAEMLKEHLKGLLTYSTYKITNAVSEGFNSKIQVIKSGARGFRNTNNFRIAILFHCGNLDLYPQ